VKADGGQKEPSGRQQIRSFLVGGAERLAVHLLLAAMSVQCLD
jgi:hypothetical protein